MIKYLIAIDPGLSKSGTGITVFRDGIVFDSEYVAPQGFQKTLKDILEFIAEHRWDSNTDLKDTEIVVEESFYPGKANKTHQRYIGVLLYVFPELKYIAPASVKKLVAGHGRASKDEVKIAVRKVIGTSTIKDWIDWDNEDVVDSISIGLAHMMKNED